MAIRLINGRLQQRRKNCAKQQLFTENSMRYIHYNGWLPLRVTESTNRHITLHQRTG